MPDGHGRQRFHSEAPCFHNQAEIVQDIKNNVTFIRKAIQVRSSPRDIGSWLYAEIKGKPLIERKCLSTMFKGSLNQRQNPSLIKTIDQSWKHIAANNAHSITFPGRAASANALIPQHLSSGTSYVSREQLPALKTKHIFGGTISTSHQLWPKAALNFYSVFELEQSLGKGARVNYTLSNLSPTQGSIAVS